MNERLFKTFRSSVQSSIEILIKSNKLFDKELYIYISRNQID
jgi:hypothetical protein